MGSFYFVEYIKPIRFKEARFELMKNNFTFIVVGLLISIGVFFIIFNVLKFNKISGYIISGLVYGLILNVLYKRIKSK
jgi:hypothetical protein